MRERLIKLLKQAEKQQSLNAVCGDIDSLIDSPRGAEFIADYLLENGVVVPPCKVGGTVYCLIQGFENPLKATVNRITVQVSGVVISCSVSGYFGQSYVATDFGKTVFFTREEAEKFLKGGATE